MRREHPFLNGIILVEPSCLQWAAWIRGNTALWALGDTPREAIGNLVQTHPDELIAAICQATARPAEGQGEG
jgi:hypothetical protein